MSLYQPLIQLYLPSLEFFKKVIVLLKSMYLPNHHRSKLRDYTISENNRFLEIRRSGDCYLTAYGRKDKIKAYNQQKFT